MRTARGALFVEARTGGDAAVVEGVSQAPSIGQGADHVSIVDVAGDVFREQRPVVSARAFHHLGVLGHFAQAPEHDVVHIVVVVPPLGRFVDEVDTHLLVTLPVVFQGGHELVHGVLLVIEHKLFHGGQGVGVLHPGETGDPGISARDGGIVHVEARSRWNVRRWRTGRAWG